VSVRVAAMDLGSNSFHLLVADADPDGAVRPVLRDKEMLRLGSAVAATGKIGKEAGDAAAETVCRFADLARSLNADKVVACATAAFRQAHDGRALAERLGRDADVAVRVIDGKEEARLIFGAVSASVVLDPSPVMALDLGGGSLEIMVGGPRHLLWADSVDVGVARVAARFGGASSFSGADFKRLQGGVAGALASAGRHAGRLRPRLAVGSSGTLGTLVRLAATRRDGAVPASVNHLSVTRRQLRSLAAELASMTGRQRAALPGVDGRRADQLPAGAVVAVTAMQLAGVDTLVGCDWALREGMVLDAVAARRCGPDPRSIRRQSVLDLCQRSRWNEDHGVKVARLATQLFDATRCFHHMGEDQRDLLELGGLLHDIGEMVSADGHERHGAYVVENASLRGFQPREVAVLACLVRFHRRGAPKPSFPAYASLSRAERLRVTHLVALLQVADGLDRSHGGPLEAVDVRLGSGTLELYVDSAAGVDVERWCLRRKRELFEKTFGRRLELRCCLEAAG